MIWRASTCCSSVRRERLPAGAVQRRMVTQKFVILGPIPSSSRRGRCCSTEASLVRQLSRHATRCGVVFPWSHARPTTSPPEGRSRGHNEVLDAPGVGVRSQSEEQSRGTRDQPAAARRRWRAQERRALWFSQYSPSLSCQSAFLLHDFPRSAVQWVNSRSEDGRPRCCVVSKLLVPWGVCCSFSLANMPFDCGCCAEAATSLATGSRSY